MERLAVRARLRNAALAAHAIRNGTIGGHPPAADVPRMNSDLDRSDARWIHAPIGHEHVAPETRVDVVRDVPGLSVAIRLEGGFGFSAATGDPERPLWRIDAPVLVGDVKPSHFGAYRYAGAFTVRDVLPPEARYGPEGRAVLDILRRSRAAPPRTRPGVR